MQRHRKLNFLIACTVPPLVLVAVLFLSAGTLNYWEGWLFLAVFCIASILSTISLSKNDPALLERRMKAGPGAEKRAAQRIIMSCLIFLFLGMLAVAGLDHRFSWSNLPKIVILIGNLIIALSFVVFEVVMRTNSFASSTIELANGQKVISTGPYSLVRHPMYFGGMILLLGIPLALGSLWAMLVLVPLVPILIWRIVDEEKLLKEQLDGYTEYCAKVKYRLIPWLY